MALVIPYLTRSRLAGGSRYPLEFEHLRPLLRELCSGVLYVDGSFLDQEGFGFEAPGEGVQQSAYPLIDFQHDLKYAPANRRRSKAPWRTQPRPTVLRMRVMGIPHEVATRAGLTREHVLHVTLGLFHHLSPRDLFSRRWRVIVSLAPRLGVVMAEYAVWEGSRQLCCGLVPGLLYEPVPTGSLRYLEALAACDALHTRLESEQAARSPRTSGR